MLEKSMAKPALWLAVSAMAAVALGLGAAPARTAPEHLPELVWIPPGPFVAGSDAAEREAAYRLDEQAYGHSVTRARGWYDAERPRTTIVLSGYHITRTPITNRQYAEFVAATGHPAPAVDRDTWDGYGLIHPYERTRPYQWTEDRPPEGKADHPAVLVSQADARAYAGWLSEATGRAWRLPSDREGEKAARGRDGRRFPWGDEFDAARLNSHDSGPFATTAVGSFAAGASPYGMLDAAGQVFEWTATETRPGYYLVKGGSWDDKGCGVCRPAARHSRPAGLKHILIGFRLVRPGA